jgi:hypothetical protein
VEHLPRRLEKSHLCEFGQFIQSLISFFPCKIQESTTIHGLNHVTLRLSQPIVEKLNEPPSLKAMGWTLHSQLFKPLPATTEFLVLLVTETADLSKKLINPQDWEEFVVEFG